MECIVCKSKIIEVFAVIDEKKYWKCKNCYAKFLDKSHYIDHKLEKKRYLEHNNVLIMFHIEIFSQNYLYH